MLNRSSALRPLSFPDFISFISLTASFKSRSTIFVYGVDGLVSINENHLSRLIKYRTLLCLVPGISFGYQEIIVLLQQKYLAKMNSFCFFEETVAQAISWPTITFDLS